MKEQVSWNGYLIRNCRDITYYSMKYGDFASLSEATYFFGRPEKEAHQIANKGFAVEIVPVIAPKKFFEQ